VNQHSKTTPSKQTAHAPRSRKEHNRAIPLWEDLLEPHQ
jgi:hypothetical protein